MSDVYLQLGKATGSLAIWAPSQFNDYFKQKVNLYGREILSGFRKAAAPDRIAEHLKSKITLEQYLDFMEGRFNNLKEVAGDPDDYEPGLEPYKMNELLEGQDWDRHPNRFGMFLMMQEMGIILPFA